MLAPDRFDQRFRCEFWHVGRKEVYVVCQDGITAGLLGQLDLEKVFKIKCLIHALDDLKCLQSVKCQQLADAEDQFDGDFAQFFIFAVGDIKNGGQQVTAGQKGDVL